MVQKYIPVPPEQRDAVKGAASGHFGGWYGCAVFNQQKEKKQRKRGMSCGGGDCLGESITGFTQRADAWVKGAGRSLYQSQLTEQVGGTADLC